MPGMGMMPMYNGGYPQPSPMLNFQQPYGPLQFGFQDLNQYQMQMMQQFEA